MKAIRKNTASLILLSILTLAIFIASCKKDNTLAEVSDVSVINASPIDTELDFVIDNKKVNTQAFKYGNIIDYFTANSGTRTFDIYNRADKSKVLSSPLNLAYKKIYSIFIVDTASKTKFVLVKDDLTRPESGKAKIRFIHLSPDASGLDVKISSASVLFSDKAFKEYTDFKTIDGDKTYSFDIVEKGTSNVMATLKDIQIKKNKIYTILVKGLKSKNNNYKFDAEIITNLE